MDYKSYRGDSPRRKKRHWLAAALLLLGLGLGREFSSAGLGRVHFLVCDMKTM